MKTIDVLGLGMATLDILTPVPRLPKSDEVFSVPGITLRGGGPVATALVELARLGARTEYLGPIAADSWGAMIEHDFDLQGIRHSHSPRIDHTQSIVSVILIEQSSGSRSILYHSEGSPVLSPEAVDPELVGSARILHLDGYHLQAALYAARLAHQEGVLVSLDGGAGEPWEGMQDLLKLVDILIVARQFAVTMTGVSDVGEAVRELGRYGARQVVITDGIRGSWFWDGRVALHQDAYKIKPIDTTGAGDIYHGAFLYAFLKGWDPKECLGFASAAAALKCTNLEGWSALAGPEEISQFIADAKQPESDRRNP